MKAFGIGKMDDDLIKRLPVSHHFLRRGIVFAQRDFGRIVTAIESKKEFAVLTGIKPSGIYHFGSKMVIDQVKYLQDLGGKVFFCVADIEAFHANQQSLEDSAKLAVDNLADVLALGIDERSYFYKQSQEETIKLNGYLYARNVTVNMMKAIYGEQEMGHYVSALAQVGDILLPQQPKFGGPKPTVIPIGLDQDPHMRLTRDIAAKQRLILPSSTYNKFMHSLGGQAKMSKSEPLGMLTLNDDEKTVKKKVNRALTGGKESVEVQKKEGASPEKCMVYELLLFNELDDEVVKKRFDDCRAGKIMCGECKADVIERLNRFLKQHQEKKKKMMPKAEKILAR